MKSSESSPTKRFGLGLLVVWWAACGQALAVLPVAATGASVDESRVTRTVYVDPAHIEAADDDQHGAADAPFATLGFACQAAAKAKDANVGVKVVLAAGTYRETAEIRAPLNNAPDSDAPLVIEAAECEQAVIDGADTEGWSPSTWKAEDARWTHPWPFRRNAVMHPAGLPANATGESYRRGDLIFINGTLLRQVNTAADLAPGCFWGMLPTPNGGRHGHAVSTNGWPVAVVQPPPDTELAGSIIQVGVRARGLTIIGRRNVVVRGLLIQHAAEPGGAGERTAGLALEGCSNVLVEDVLSQWNDGAGLAISERAGGGAVSMNFTLRRVRLLHNGSTGLSVSGVKNLLAEDNETSFNNFRGDWAGWVDPLGPAGAKTEGVGGSTWRRQHAVGNACRGLWWAGGSTDITVEDAVARDNFVSGMCFENDSGPVRVLRCLITGTKTPPGAPDNAATPAGLSMTGTPDVTLESNVFASNAVAQLGLGEGAPGKAVLRAERHVYRHNVFYASDAGATLYRMPASDPETKDRDGSYYATLRSGENCFWNPEKAEGFEVYVVHPGNRKAGPTYTTRAWKLEEWQANMRTESTPQVETGSVWQDPLFADPAEGDYRLRKASPVAGWDLPSDEAAAGQ